MLKQFFAVAVALGVCAGANNAHALGNNSALSFAGTGHVALTTGPATNLLKGFSIECWAYFDPPTTYSTGARRIISNFQNNPSRGYGLGVTTTTVASVPSAKWRFTTFGIKDYDTTAVPVALATWNHVAMVLDSNNQATFYINGSFAQALPHNADGRISTAPLNIGRNPVNTEHWYGKIDEIRIWSYERTLPQIQADMNRQVAWDEAGLVGYWRLNEGGGLTTMDNSLNTADGTLFEATWVTGPGIPVLTGPDTAVDADWEMYN
jgi:hypothetical protein